MNSVIAKLQKMAKDNPGKEICGLVDSSFDIHPITNVAKDTKSCFIFSKGEYFALIKSLHVSGKKVLCLYHSHPSHSPEPSKADRDYTSKTGVPQLVITPTEYRIIENA